MSPAVERPDWRGWLDGFIEDNSAEALELSAYIRELAIDNEQLRQQIHVHDAAQSRVEALEKENAALKGEIQQAKQAAIEEFCAPDMCWAKGMDEVAREHIAVVEARVTAAEHKAEAAQGVVHAVERLKQVFVDPDSPDYEREVGAVVAALTAYQDTPEG